MTTDACGVGGGPFDAVREGRSGWRRGRFGAGLRGLETTLRFTVGVDRFTLLDRFIHVSGWVAWGWDVWLSGKWDVG